MRDYDIVLYGASGFTGRLVAEYLWEVYGNGEDLTWPSPGAARTSCARSPLDSVRRTFR